MENQNLEYVTKSLSDKERLAGIFWIVMGLLQVLSFVAVIAGAYNIIVGFQRLSQSKKVLNPWPTIVADYDRWLTNIIIALVINLFFGGFIGCLVCVWDFMTRDFVLKNKAVFESANNIY